MEKIKEIDFKNEILKYKDDIIKHTINLININSVLVENEVVNGITYPFGIGNFKALEYVLDLGKSLGFEVFNVDGVCGHIEYGSGSEIVGVLTHLDVVPALGDWLYGPFNGTLCDDLIYGRGSADNKGAAIVSIFALLVIKNLNIKLKRKIRLIFGTDEETNSRGLKRYLEVCSMPEYSISPDADFPLIYAEKGMITLDIISNEQFQYFVSGGVRYNVVAPLVKIRKNDSEANFPLNNLKLDKDNNYLVEGVSAHAMEPDNGCNAILKFASMMENHTSHNLIKFINNCLKNTRLKLMNLDYTSSEMGDLTCNLGILEMSDKAKLGINIRYPIGVNFEEFITKFKNKASEYQLEVVNVNHSPLHYVNKDSLFIKTLEKIYREYTLDDTPIKTIGGGTYARSLKNAVAYGLAFPNEKEVAHEANEYVRVSSLMLGGAIICKAIKELGNLNES